MSAEPIRFAVVGGGLISAVHAEAISSLEGTELFAFVGNSGARARAEQFHTRHFESLDSAVRESGVQAVVICTPTATHARMAATAAKLGMHVLVEKPIDSSLEAAEALVSECAARGLTLGVVSQRRFDSGFLVLEDAVRAGSFGQLALGSAAMKCWRDEAYYAKSWHGTATGGGGGALINQGIHIADLLLSVMGRVERVTALRRSVAHAVEVEDTVLAMLEFESGAVGTLEATTAFFSRTSGPDIPNTVERIEVSGTLGSMILESGHIVYDSLASSTGAPASPAPAQNGTALPLSHFAGQYEDFVSAIRTGNEPRSSGGTGLEVLRLIHAIYRSSDEQRAVAL
jgi:UDP-N-acetyl-2-amino-2-deoxyglucuronate dehydrogenase